MSETKKRKAYRHGPTLKDKLVEIKEKHGIHAVGEALMSPLVRMAQEFSSGTRLGPGFGSFSPFTKMDSKTIGFMGIEYLTDYMNKFEWPLAPEIGFRGLKHAKMGDDNSVKEAMAIFGIKSLSPSGINIEFEVPLAIRNGGFLEPSVMMVQGTPQIICQASIDSLMDRCTFNEPMDIRGGIFSPPLEQEVRDSLLSLREEVGDMPHVNRGMFYIAQRENLYQQGLDILSEEMTIDWEGILQDVSRRIEAATTFEELQRIDFDYTGQRSHVPSEMQIKIGEWLDEKARELFGKSWREESRERFYASRQAQAVSEIEVDKVINMRQQGMDLNTIAQELDLDFVTVQQIWTQYQEEMIRAMRIAQAGFFYVTPEGQKMEVAPLGEGEGPISIDPETKLPYYQEEGPRVPKPVETPASESDLVGRKK